MWVSCRYCGKAFVFNGGTGTETYHVCEECTMLSIENLDAKLKQVGDVACKGRALGITSYLLSTKLRSQSTTIKTPIHTIHKKHKEDEHSL